MEKKGEIIFYNPKNGKNLLEVRLENETVWLTQKPIAELFGTQPPAITKHLSNIFKSKELNEKTVSSILELTAQGNKKYKTNFYNLDALLNAQSNPDYKDIMIKLTINLVNE